MYAKVIISLLHLLFPLFIFFYSPMVVRCRSTRRRMRGVGSITRRRRQGGSSSSMSQRLSIRRSGAKPKSERQPCLRKALVAYPVFWSKFISDFIVVLETSPRFSKLMKYLDRETFRQPNVLLELQQTFDANEFARFEHLKAQDLAFVKKHKEWTQTHIRSLTMKSAAPETESSPLKCSDFLDIVKLRWKAKLPSDDVPSKDIIDSQIQMMTDYVSGLHETMLILQSRQPRGEVDDDLSEKVDTDSMVNAGDMNTREQRSVKGKTNKRYIISSFARGVAKRFFPFAMAEKQVQQMIEILQSDICEDPHIILAELVRTLVRMDSHYTLFSTAFKENAVVRKLPDIIKNEAWLINDDILADSRFDDTQHKKKKAQGGGCLECIGVEGDCCEDGCIPTFCPCCAKS